MCENIRSTDNQGLGGGNTKCGAVRACGMLSDSSQSHLAFCNFPVSFTVILASTEWAKLNGANAVSFVVVKHILENFDNL